VIFVDLKAYKQRQQAYDKALNILDLINKTIEYKHTEFSLPLLIPV